MKVRLGDICNIQYGCAFNSTLFTNDNRFPPLIRIRDVKRGYSETFYTGKYDTNYVVHAGDLLVGMDGEFNIARWRSRDALLNQRVCKITVRHKIDEEYLRFALSKALKKIEARTSFVTVKHLSAKELNALEIESPSLEKQREISGILTKIETMICLYQQQFIKLDELVKSRFMEMFGDPIVNSKKFKIVQLNSLGTWQSGGTPSRFNSAYFQGDIDWYSAGELNVTYLEHSAERITQEALQKSSAKLFKAGSMLIGMYDTAAFKMGILKRDSSSNQACACITPNTNVNILWLYHNLHIMKVSFLQKRIGVRQKNLNLGMIKSLAIPLPPLPLQQQFAAFVKKVDKSKLAVKQSLEKLETLKKSLMQQYFG